MSQVVPRGPAGGAVRLGRVERVEHARERRVLRRHPLEQRAGGPLGVETDQCEGTVALDVKPSYGSYADRLENTAILVVEP